MRRTATGLLVGALIGLSAGIPTGHHRGTGKALDWSRTARLTCQQAHGSLRKLADVLGASEARLDTLLAIGEWYESRPHRQRAQKESTHHVESHLTEELSE